MLKKKKKEIKLVLSIRAVCNHVAGNVNTF